MATTNPTEAPGGAEITINTTIMDMLMVWALDVVDEVNGPGLDDDTRANCAVRVFEAALVKIGTTHPEQLEKLLAALVTEQPPDGEGTA